MQARDHHAPSMRAFLVKLIKLVAQRLLVSSRIPSRERKRHDVVHVEGIGNGDKIPPAHRDDERLVMAWLVNVIEKAEILQGLKDVNGVAHPIGVPADRLLASYPQDRLDAVGDEAFLLITGELIRIVPDPAMRRSLVTASYDFLSEVGSGFHGLADHE